jgi:DEAD/DEAH box helicase domain-containing protein
VRGKIRDGLIIKKEEDEEEDEFGRSIQMFAGDRTFIGVHR